MRQIHLILIFSISISCSQNNSKSEIQKDTIKIIATRYNRGSGLSIEKIKKNLSYGNSIYKHKNEILSALAGID